MIKRLVSHYDAAKVRFVEEHLNEFNITVPEYTPEVHDFVMLHGGIFSYPLMHYAEDASVRSFAKSMSAFWRAIICAKDAEF